MKRRLTRRLTGAALLAGLLATLAGTAVAYFTTTGAGDASAEVSKLSPPTITAATPAAGGTVALTWNTVTAPGPGTVSYSVSRDGGDADGNCHSTLSTTACVDSGLATGTYSYVVTAKWHSWSVSSAVKTAQVTIGPAHHLVLTAVSSTPTAGVADNLTITAKDAGGGTVTTYSGAHDLTFSGAVTGPDGTVPTVSNSAGNDVAFGSVTAIDFSAGVATVSSAKNGAMKLYKGGSASLKVTDGTLSSEPSLTVTVAAAAAAKFVLTAATSALAAGETDNLTITAQDTYGNVATTYAGSKSLTFSGASASPGGTTPTVVNSAGTVVNFGSATTISFTAGVAAVSSAKNGVMRLYASGEPDVNVSDGSITTKAPLEVTVSPLAASKFALAATTTTPAAGAADNLTITAQDTYGNVATTYAGSKSLTFSGASASPNGTVPTVSDSAGSDVAFGSATPISFSAGVATVSSAKNGAMKLYKSGSTSLKVTDGTLLTPTALVVTVAATATRFSLTASSTSLTAGTSVNLTITALDVYENTVTTYAGSKSLTFSGASASPNATKPTVSNSSGSAVAFGTATPITFTTGIATVSTTKNGVMKLYASGDADITVSDGSISNQSPLEVTVAPLAASKLALAAATTTPAAGAADNLTITAQDTYGNVATTYAGSKSLSFSGASAGTDGTVPTVSDSSGTNIAFGTATSINFDAGVASVSGATNGVMKLYKPGATSLTVSDGSLSGALSVTVATTAIKFAFSASLTAFAAGGSSNLTVTALDTYGNTVTTYTGSKSLTFSGASASPNATAPTVANSSGTATAFGTATAITFTSGVATISSTKNGVMKLYRAEVASVSVSDGSISSAAPIAVTVTPTTATRWALTNINISAGSLGSTCLFTCTLTGLGNSGTVKAKVAVTDAYGNTVSALGSGHAAKVTTNGGGSISGTPLTIPSTGAAETATTFTYTSKSSGSFSEIVTAAAAEGTAYTSATLTASK